MTRVAKFVMTAAAATMSVAPAMAAPTTPLTAVDSTRAATDTENESNLKGRGGYGIFIALAAGIAIIVAIIVVGSKKPDRPTSP